MISVFESIYVMDNMNGFMYAEPFLKPTWLMNDISDVILNSVCRYFTDDFFICVYQGDWSAIFCTRACLHMSLSEFDN